MTITYPSTSVIDMMTTILAGLSGASCQIKNQNGANMLSSSFVLSSSPGFLLNDGTIVINGLTTALTIGAGNQGVLASVSIDGIAGLPVVNSSLAFNGGSAMIADTGISTVYFVGAIVPSPVGNSITSITR